MNKKMTLSLIIIGALILIIGLIMGLKTFKPMHFNVVAGLVIVIGTFFGLFGKQLQDESSSKKSDKILATGESTEGKVNKLQTKIDEQATTIDNLRSENTNLHSKLAATSKDIFDISNKGYNVSLTTYNEQRENIERQNRPVLQVGNFDVGNPRDEFFRYEITNLNINPAQIIWVTHGVSPHRPTQKHPPAKIKVYEGRKMFRPRMDRDIIQRNCAAFTF